MDAYMGLGRPGSPAASAAASPSSSPRRRSHLTPVDSSLPLRGAQPGGIIRSRSIPPLPLGTRPGTFYFLNSTPCAFHEVGSVA